MMKYSKRTDIYSRLRIVLFTIVVFSPVGAAAMTLDEIEKKRGITPSSSSAYDHFGAAVAVFGDTVAIGAPNYDSGWKDSGAVYVYQKVDDHWKFIKRISAGTPRPQGLFGYSAAIEGSHLIVGEPGSTNHQAGYVHVFQRNTGGMNNWGWVRTIAKPDDCYLRTRDRFGESVAMSTGKVVIGAPRACKDRQNWMETTGAAYLYDDFGAGFVKKFTAYNGEEYDHFGSSVSVCGRFVFIGAPDADSGLLRSDSGAAYVFDTEDSSQVHSYLRPNSTSEGDRFGYSLSCYGSDVVVGAPALSSSYGSDPGKGVIYYYHKDDDGGDAWKLRKKLYEEDYFNEDPDRNNQFGQTISFHKNYLIIGYGESKKKEAGREPAAEILKLEEGKWRFIRAIVMNTSSSCQTSSFDKGISVATDGQTFVTGDMEIETTGELCAQGLGSAAIYEKSMRKIINLSPLQLLLKSDEH